MINRSFRSFRSVLATFLATGLFANPGYAEEPVGEPATFSTLEPALTPHLVYAVDTLRNTQGGFQTGWATMGLVDFGVEIDLDQVLSWKDTTLVASAYVGHGTDFSANFVGDLGVVSNLYTDTNFNFFHLYLETGVGPGDSFFRIGQFGIDDDFMITETSDLFIGSPFQVFNTQSANMPGPIFPLAAPGLLYHHSPTGDWYWQTGLYVGDAGPGGPRDRGFDWRWGGGAGLTIFSEVGVTYHEDGGIVKVGGYWHSGEFEQFSTGDSVDGLGAIYALLDHPIIPSSADSFGLNVFLRASLAGQDDRVVATSQIDAGFAIYEVFTADDVFGLAVSHTNFGDDYQAATPGVSSSETVLEATYQLPINDFFTIQPDIQYIFDPHESGRDALVIGLRAELSFY